MKFLEVVCYKERGRSCVGKRKRSSFVEKWKMTLQQEVPKPLLWPQVPVVFPSPALSIQLWSSSGDNWKRTVCKAKIYVQGHRDITGGADIAIFLLFAMDSVCSSLFSQKRVVCNKVGIGSANYKNGLFCLFWCHSGLTPAFSKI